MPKTNPIERGWQLLFRLSPRQWLRRATIELRCALDLPARLDSPDRHVLEQEILPHYAGRPELKRILFVGCSWYSKHYERLFAHREQFATLDADALKRRYGARQHVVAPMESMSLHFEPGQLDLIVCNGVFGWGLDQPEQVAQAMQAAFSSLRPGGELLLGWNDIPDHAPFDPAASIEAAGFERIPLAPFGAWRTRLDMPTRHTFEAYRRPLSSASSSAFSTP